MIQSQDERVSVRERRVPSISFVIFLFTFTARYRLWGVPTSSLATCLFTFTAHVVGESLVPSFSFATHLFTSSHMP